MTSDGMLTCHGHYPTLACINLIGKYCVYVDKLIQLNHGWVGKLDMRGKIKGNV